MTRLRVLLVALAAVCVLALVVVTVNLINMHAYSPPDRGGPEAAQRDATETTRPATSPDAPSWVEDDADQRRPPPEPNVFGILVDEEGNAVEGAEIVTRLFVPYLMTPYWTATIATDTVWETAGFTDEVVGESGIDERDSSPFFETPEITDPWGLDAPPGYPRGAACDCTTDSEGRFAFHVPERAWYELTVHKVGYAERRQTFEQPREDIRLVLYGPGAIAGRVVDAETGEPVRRFAVTFGMTLEDGEAPFGPPGRPRGQPKETLVESETGEFRLDHVTDETCPLIVHADRYAPATVGDICAIPGRTANVTVRMHRSARLIGKVIWASSGEPVPDVVLEVRTGVRTFDEPYEFRPRHYSTNEDGGFDIPVLPAGKATISVGRDCQGGSLGGGFPDKRPPALHQQDVLLPPGETTEALIRVPDKPGTIRGRVTDVKTSEPLPGIPVSLCVGYAWGEDAPKPLRTVSDDDGCFEFAGLAPGRSYALSASRPHYAVKDVPPICLQPGQTVDGVVIELAEWARLVGRVCDKSGRSIQAHLYCYAERGANAETDEDGEFVYEEVAPGVTLVTCTLEDDWSTSRERIVFLEPGQTTQVDFILGRGSFVSGTITVGGAPIRDGGVQLLASVHSTKPTTGYRKYGSGIGSHGRFRIANVEPGEYTLVFTCWGRTFPNPLTAQTTVRVNTTDIELELELPAGRISGQVICERTGEPLGPAMVYIQKEQDLQEPDDAALDLSMRRFVLADPYTGQYSFELVGDGRYSIVASKEGYGTARIEADVLDGESATQTDIYLGKGYEVTGTIRAAHRRVWLQEASVTVRDTSGKLVLEREFHPSFHGYELGRNGEFTLGCLPEGEYVIEADSPNTARLEKRITVSDTGRNVVDVRLPTGKQLLVEVMDSEGEPLQGAIADVRDPRGRSPIPTTHHYERDWYMSIWNASDTTGVTRIEYLTHGIYSLTVKGAGYKTTKRQVVVRDGKDTRVKVVLERLPDE